VGDRLDAFIEHATIALRADERIVAAWLVGSMAAGTADAYSDVDLRIAVAEDAYDAFVGEWQRLPDRLSPTVMRRKIGAPDSPIVIGITPAWLRFDIAIVQGTAPNRAGDRVLFDRRPPQLADAPAPALAAGPGQPTARAGRGVPPCARADAGRPRSRRVGRWSSCS